MSRVTENALLVKTLSGFYYVRVGEETYECKARGVFRKENLSPCVGDRVDIELLGGGKGSLVRVHERRNSLLRPPLANLDQLVMVTSVCDPQPNLLVLDKMIGIAEYKEIEPVLVITKTDMGDHTELEAIYKKAGFAVYPVCNRTGEGVEAVKAALAGKLSAFTGNSGVGKSSLLNAIDSRLGLRTAETSQKLGRGRHTTRHVELFELEGGGWVADTPGFSEVELLRFEAILRDQMQYCFREFGDYIGQCRFTGCAHTCEKGCAVLQAVEEGAIAPSRHKSYLAMYEDVKDLREWNLK